ncbi:MAG TPA: ribonuclease HII [Candidatus Limnocylindria bacterium]|nr:ribonuclease HII [Candidatus Limnocylindria bacterium]
MGPASRRSVAATRLAETVTLNRPNAPRRRHATFAAAGALSGRASVAPWHRLRLDPDFGEERDLWERGYRLIAGVDEVGRGCLAGPVVVGAVILPLGWKPDGLRDSKMLKPEDRERLADEIVGRALSWSLAAVEPAVIDRINILQATLLAVGLASARLPVRPDALLLDGTLHRPDITVHQRVVIDGDRLCASIAAASIVAKVFRDRLMVQLDGRYPGYDLASNKGYAAPEHRAGLRALGTAPVHRLTFASCADVEQTTLWEAVGPGGADELDEIDDPEAVEVVEAVEAVDPLVAIGAAERADD